MSRSCQSATFSKPGLRVAAQQPRDPGDPLGRRSGSACAASPTSPSARRTGTAPPPRAPRCAGGAGSRWRTARARRPRARSPTSSSAWRSRGTTWVDTFSRARPEPLQHGLLHLRPVRRVGAHRARQRAHRHALDRALQPQQVAVRLEGEAGELHAERGGLGVHAVRAAHAERVHVLARALRRARRGSRRAPPTRIIARLRELQAERGVEHVGGGEAVVDPAPRLADRAGHHVHEGRHVVVGDLLALLAPPRP